MPKQKKLRPGQTGTEANQEKRTKRFPIWLTLDEWATLQQKAVEAGSSSTAQYARSKLFPSNHLADQETKAEQKLRVQLLASLGKIGSNINQIARSLNRMKTWNQTTEGMFEELAKIQEHVTHLAEIFRRRK